GGEMRLPMNPFADAERGDWAVFVVTSREGDRRAEAEVFVARVAAIAGSEVATRLDARTHGGQIMEGATRIFSRTEAPSFAAFFTPANARYDISNATFEPSSREVLGRRFACTKASFDRRDRADPEPQRVHVTAWLSPEVRGCGVLHADAEGRDAHGCATSVTFELLGFGGPDGRATIGKTVDEVPLDSKPVL